MKLAPSRQFQSIQEQDEFLALFPHRYDYIWAEHPELGDRPNWQTESRHPLSDRLIQQGASLYGVRFGKLTRYLLLDIDSGSLYHPAHDPFAIGRMVAALEPLNLVAGVAVSSSYSAGIHLYLPFKEEQESWAIAQAAAILLEQAGFKLTPGHLELFPNPRPYSETLSLYLAHRLPMQAGSYLLNEDFQPIYGNQATFVYHWKRAQNRNTLTHATLKRVLKQVQRKRYRLSTKASKFLNDLNTEIEPGWTGSGQTNYLLGRITMREYVFGHVRRSCEPLAGDALVEAICEVARLLPGFTDYCDHQAELEQRANHFARSIQLSHYYPFGSKQQLHVVPLSEPVVCKKLNKNEQRALEARDRLRKAVADLQERAALPTQVTARRKAIRAYGIGGSTLDKYQELWHPKYLKPLLEEEYRTLGSVAVVTESLNPLPAEEYRTFKTNKLVRTSAARQWQAEKVDQCGGVGGISTAYLATLQRWLESGDAILVAEAQRFFQFHRQQADLPIALPEGENEEAGQGETIMGRGFGVSQPKQSGRSKPSGKSKEQIGLDEIRRLSESTDAPRDLELEASIQVEFFKQKEENPQELALAWEAGVYNPLGPDAEDVYGARLLDGVEEDWLHFARVVGWLDVKEEYDAIFYTTPPPAFDIKAADWYVYPLPISPFEEPLRLKDAIVQHPVPLELIQVNIAEKVDCLGWTEAQFTAFVLETCEKPVSELNRSDWECVWFEVKNALTGD